MRVALLGAGHIGQTIAGLLGESGDYRVTVMDRSRAALAKLASLPAVNTLQVDFQGENDVHRVALEGTDGRCTCDFVHGWGSCAHTLARERVLDGMVPQAPLAAFA